MPFACLRLVNPAISITAGLGILRLSVAAGDVAVLDTRQPSRTRYPVVLHAGPMRCVSVRRSRDVIQVPLSRLHGGAVRCGAVSKERYGKPSDLVNSGLR